ncbi:MAG: 50S ribosomal protein L9 [Planctomycetota bacterium]
MKELLLQQDVERLGKAGAVVRIADGYARNYLIPRKLAIPVTPQNLKRIEDEKKRKVEFLARRKSEMEVLAKKLEVTSCTITAKVNEEGKLFGSVTPEQVAEAYVKEGIPIEPDWVVLPGPIKELGVYGVKICLGPDLEIAGRVWVIES